MDIGTAICVVLFTLLVLFYISRHTGKYVFPPGPKGWPIIGSVLDVSSTHLHVSLTDIGKKYGDIFTVNLLGTQAVVLNSVESIRGAFFTEEHGGAFAGRPHSFLGKYTDDNCSSFSFMSTCKMWQRLRKMVYKTINMYGDGVQEAENNILEELGFVCRWLEERDGKDVDLGDVIVPSLSNIMTYLLIGRRFDYDSPELKAAVRMSYGINEMGTPGIDAVMTRIPFLRFIPFGYGALYRGYMDGIQEYLKTYYHAQKATHNPDITRGLIDVLLKTQEKIAAKGDDCPIKNENVTSTMKDTIEAGTLTTRGSLLSFFLIIAHNPDVAKKIQDEINREIGEDRYPSLKDRPNMPYTEAAILETVRFVTPIPLALPHCTMEETTYKGYTLPKDTLVLPNYWGAHHDSTIWDKPFDFIPERFLDSSGNMVPLEHPNRKNLMPFSIGKRSCPGENFAKSRIFLFITTLLQKFNLRRTDGVPLPPCDSRHFGHGIVPCPKPFKVRVEARF